MQDDLILASSSPYRKSLLERLKLNFSCITPNIDETPLVNESATELVKRLSLNKARTIAELNPNSWVIGSDQVAQTEGHILGKPLSHPNAFDQLKSCSGKSLEFLTGITLIRKQCGTELYSKSTVAVKFRRLTDNQIDNYLHRDHPYDCAGSFKIESLGIALFEYVKSDDPTALEGFPLITLCNLLSQVGIEII